MKYLFGLLLFILISSCAKLSLVVDIYTADDKDPLPRQNGVEYIHRLSEEIFEYAETKKAVHQTLFDLYLEFQKYIHGSKFNETDYQLLRASKIELDNHIDQKTTDVVRKIILHSTDQNGASTSGLQQDKTELIKQAVTEITEDTFTNIFKRQIVSEWNQRVEEYTSENIKLLTGDSIPRDSLEMIKSSLREQIPIINKIANPNIQYQLGLLDTMQLDSTTHQNQFFENYKVLLHKIPNQTLDQLYISVQDHQIRHLLYARQEDYGDPIWRTITNSDNTDWKKVYGKTRFAAKGNSSVIIAKDSPIDFRIKQGENDPKALIKSQLIVSRSLVDLGLSAAGLDFDPTKDSSTSEDEADSTDSLTHEENSSAIALKQAFLSKSLATLRESLDEYVEKLDTVSVSHLLKVQTETITHLENYQKIILDFNKRMQDESTTN